MADNLIQNMSVKPCQSEEEIIRSKDFKRVLNRIFKTIEGDNFGLPNFDPQIFMKMELAFDKLLSDQKINKQEFDLISSFLLLASKPDNQISIAIAKVLKKISPHSFLDNLSERFTRGNNDFINKIKSSWNISTVLFTVQKKALAQVDTWLNRIEQTRIQPEIINIDPKTEAANNIIALTFGNMNPEWIINLAKKITTWKIDTDNKEIMDFLNGTDYKILRNVFEIIIMKVNEKKEKARLFEKFKWEKNDESYSLCREIFWITINPDIGMENKMSRISKLIFNN